jgi:hypothetical protein
MGQKTKCKCCKKWQEIKYNGGIFKRGSKMAMDSNTIVILKNTNQLNFW